ncbi:MAG: caxA [Proteobacteria bacterium]|nr:caxA [Pseudomonadota bacterium]
MLTPILALLAGLAILIWSADRFIAGAAQTARHFGMPPLLIGMVVVGFGTSAPELLVSLLSALQGNPGIALGNAYGSNIANIALILGLTALISPIIVHSRAVVRELPILAGATALAAWQLWDGQISRLDAIILAIAFLLIMVWNIHRGMREQGDALDSETVRELDEHAMPIRRAVFWLIVGLILLIASSRLLVWGAVDIARSLGVSDLFIGLTIIAIGTSLPELASSIIASRKDEHDIVFGNVIGSNLFNTLAVVAIAGFVQPMQVPPEVLGRDMLVMGALTLSLFAICYGGKKAGKISRWKGALLTTAFVAYTAHLLVTA